MAGGLKKANSLQLFRVQAVLTNKIVEAMRKQEEENVLRFLTELTDVNGKNIMLQTSPPSVKNELLHAAAFYGLFGAVKELINRGADPTRMNSNKQAPSALCAGEMREYLLVKEVKYNMLEDDMLSQYNALAEQAEELAEKTSFQFIKQSFKRCCPIL